MKNIKLSIAFLILGCILYSNGAYSQSLLLDSAKIAVAQSINATYDKNKNWQKIAPNDLNLRYEIFDILTLQSAIDSISNGRIYYFSLLGDDHIGQYLLVENNSPKIIQNHELTDLKKTLEFMYRNGYSPEQINESICFIINRYELDMSFAVH